MEYQVKTLNQNSRYLIDCQGIVWTTTPPPRCRNSVDLETGHAQLRLYKTREGYERVELNINGKVCLKYVHRLVAEHFLPDFNHKAIVMHRNGVKDDNRLDNLYLMDRAVFNAICQ